MWSLELTRPARPPWWRAHCLQKCDWAWWPGPGHAQDAQLHLAEQIRDSECGRARGLSEDRFSLRYFSTNVYPPWKALPGYRSLATLRLFSPPASRPKIPASYWSASRPQCRAVIGQDAVTVIIVKSTQSRSGQCCHQSAQSHFLRILSSRCEVKNWEKQNPQNYVGTGGWLFKSNDSQVNTFDITVKTFTWVKYLTSAIHFKF